MLIVSLGHVVVRAQVRLLLESILEGNGGPGLVGKRLCWAYLVVILCEILKHMTIRRFRGI